MNAEGSATGACDCYQITDDVAAQAGAIWSPNTIDLTQAFDFTFFINLGCEDVWGADGMMFVLQQNGTGVGDIGNGIGYEDYPGNPTPISTNSIAVEIDTWDSSPAIATDIGVDHIGMNSGLSAEHNVDGPTALPNMEDCAYHEFHVTWNPAIFLFQVEIDGTLYLSYFGDMVTNFFGGNPNVYFGWTGGTGGVVNEHYVCMYRDAAFTADMTTVCPNEVISFTDNSTSDLNNIIDWSWDFGDGNVSNAQNPTHAYASGGLYTVQLTITDISGCTDTETLNITVNPDININITTNDISCFGANDGTATATPTTGTAPYIYLWDDPGTQGTPTATGLSPNTYNVIVTDNDGCTGTASATINEPALLDFNSIDLVDATCGMNNGSITVNETGGTGPFMYSIDGGTTQQGSNLFAGLSPGSYDVEVEDANNCTAIQTVNIGNTGTLSIDNLVSTDENCGTADGSITATVSGGTPGYQYSIDAGANYQAGNAFNGLVAGNYTVQVLDAGGCIETANITVNSISSVSIDAINIVDPDCAGANTGSIEIIVSGGTAPYDYSVDNGANFQAGNTFSNLTAGTYDIIVDDNTGCQDNGTITLTDPAAISIDAVNATDVSCNGLTDGTIDVVASGGAGGFSYSIDAGANFQAANNFAGLPAGNYNIVVEDINGCTEIDLAVIVEPAPLTITSIDVTDVTCNGMNDGSITVNVTDGTPAYQYSIDGVNFQAGSTFNGLGAGNINVDVLDAAGCTTQDVAVISETQPITATISPDTTICIGGNATLCPSINGGTAPYSYNWNGVPGPACLSTTVAGTYNVEVVDVNGCAAAIVSQEVFINPPLSVVVTPSTSICDGETVQISAEASGGNGGPYTYNWVNQNDMSVLNGQIQDVSPSSTTTYVVGVTDGCETPFASGNTTITIHPVPTIDIAVDNTNGCAPVAVVFTNNTDLTSVSSIEWDFGNGTVISASGGNVSQTYNEPGCYDITLNVGTVNGCTTSETYTDLICVYENPVASFTYSPDDPDMFDPTVSFENNSTGGSIYQWNFADGNNSTEVNPTHVFPEVGAQNYNVSLTVTTDNGCYDMTSQVITIDEFVLYYVPNAVTPNADPMNQYFTPVFVPGFNPLDYSLKIFNRYGELLFESQDYNTGWDCTYADKIVDGGVYIWQITFRVNQSDEVFRDFGHVTVLK